MFSRSRMKKQMYCKKLISRKKNNKDFFQNENKKKNDIFDLLSGKQRDFLKRPKKRLIKENQKSNDDQEKSR